MPDDVQSAPNTPTPVPSSPSNPRKRKDGPDVADSNVHTDEKPASAPHPDEYGAGFITCQTCGTEVSFRDESNAFTTKLWDAHRLTCSSTTGPSSNSNGPVIFTPEIAAEALAHPPAKRRRAKRTEEERIEYLRSDPYVGQFEAYRVLCASCDKWIRLRPNSTYCSIPWDAHRKSCLAKKINNKNVYALEERNTLFSKDPDVRKFDPERLLCNICDKWLSLPPDDHLQAVQKWLQHRATCQKSAAASSSSAARVSNDDGSRASVNQDPESPKRVAASVSQSSNSASPHVDVPQHRFPPYSTQPQGSPPPFHALTPSNYGPAHESRRRNAEQRAANLREDPYILVVEPNRVFCKLCSKWVQLRQDSSYCAYPWMQHRQKCEARHFRRTQKAVEIAEMRGRKPALPSSLAHEEDELASDRDLPPTSRPSVAIRGSEDVESEEGVESNVESERGRMKDIKSRAEQRHAPPQSSSSSRHLYGPHPYSRHGHGHHPVFYAHQAQPYHHHKSRSAPTLYGLPQTHHKFPVGSMSQAISPPTYRRDRSQHYSRSRPNYTGGNSHISRPSNGRRLSLDEDMDADADADADMDADGDPEGDSPYDEDHCADGPTTPPASNGASSSRAVNFVRVPTRRPWPIGLADLDSSVGRKQFIFSSVEYLFASTYESTDDMSISALLAYLNAAMPPDKHEDFDTTEVARAVAAMKEKGNVIFEGDIIRLVD